MTRFRPALPDQFAGILIDRHQKLQLLAIAQVLLGSLALLLFLLNLTGSLTPNGLLLVAVGFGVLSGLELPARLVFVGLLVPKPDIPSAVAVNALAFNLARVLGPALAGALIFYFEIGAVFILGAIGSFLFFLVLVRIGPIQAASAADRCDQSPEKPDQEPNVPRLATKTGNLLALSACVCLLAHPVFEFLPMLSERTISSGAHGENILGVTVLGIAIGGGAVAGGLALLLVWNVSSGFETVGAMAGGAGICLLLLALAPTGWPTIAAFAMLSCAIVMHATGTQTCLQILAPAASRGFVLGAYITILRGTPAIGALGLGLGANQIDIKTLLVACAISVFGISCLFIRRFCR